MESHPAPQRCRRQVLDACREADGLWVLTAKIRQQCWRHYSRYMDGRRIDNALDDAIRSLADEGKIEIREPERLARPGDRAGQRKVRLAAGSVKPG